VQAGFFCHESETITLRVTVIGGKRYADDYFSSPIGPCNASYSAMAAFHSSISSSVHNPAFSAPIVMPVLR
jgi:hypothetical protein